jgi:hypothetical protein
MDAMQCTDPNKSPGIPLRKAYPDICGKASKGTVLIQIYDQMETALEKIDRGEQLPASLFSGWLKTELLPREKVLESKKARLFMAAPGDHVAISHTLFHTQNKYIYNECWPATCSAIGVDKFNGFYPMIRESMLHAKKKRGYVLVACFDGTRHDASCHEDEFGGISYVRWKRVKDKEKYMNRTKFIYRNITRTYVVTEKGQLIQINGGNKSGQGNTTVDNTLIQLRRIIYALVRMNRFDVIDELMGYFPPAVFLGDDIMIWSSLLTEEDYETIVKIVTNDIGAHWKARMCDETNWEFCSHSPTPETGYKLAGISIDKIMSSIFRTQHLSTNLERLRGELYEAVPHSRFFAALYSVAKDLHSNAGINLPDADTFVNHWYGNQCIGAPGLYESPDNQYVFYFLNELVPEMSVKQKRQVSNLQNQLKVEKAKTKRIIANNRKQAAGSAPSCAGAMVKALARGIVDPGSSDAIRYPDGTGVRTATIKSKAQSYIDFALDDTIANFGIGSFYVECHPDAQVPIVTLTPKINKGLVMMGSYTGGHNLSNFYGLYKDDVRQDDVFVARWQVLQYFDLVIPVIGPDGAPQQTLWDAGEKTAVAGNYYPPCYGLHGVGNLVDGHCCVTLEGVSPELASFDVNVTISQVDSAGAILNSTTVLNWTGSRTNFRLDLSTTPLDLFGHRIMVACYNNTIMDASISLIRAGMAYNPQKIGYKTIQLPTIQTNLQNIEQYRINAWSNWLEFTGASLTNAGSVAGCRYNGGPPAGHTGLYDYDTVSAHPESSTNMLKDGAYGWGNYLNAAQRNLRPLQATVGTKYPYIIFAGVFNGDNSGTLNDGKILKLISYHHLEFTSRSQSYTYRPGISCPELVAHVSNALAYMPPTMENKFHLKTIRDFINSAASSFAKTAGKTGRFVWDNRENIKKLVETVEPMLPLAFV